jgi:hypothetical protein
MLVNKIHKFHLRSASFVEQVEHGYSGMCVCSVSSILTSVLKHVCFTRMSHLHHPPRSRRRCTLLRSESARRSTPGSSVSDRIVVGFAGGSTSEARVGSVLRVPTWLCLVARAGTHTRCGRASGSASCVRAGAMSLQRPGMVSSTLRR